MRKALFYIGKTLELLGLFFMPTALYFGIAFPGAAGMTYEMTFLGLGVMVFFLGYVVEQVAGDPA